MTGSGEEQNSAAVLRLFGHGMEVCVEMAAMVTDAGLIAPTGVVYVAGTARGTDIAALIYSATSNAVF